MLNLEKKLAFRNTGKGSKVRFLGRVGGQFPLVFAFEKLGAVDGRESITQRAETGRTDGSVDSDFDIVNVIEKNTTYRPVTKLGTVLYAQILPAEGSAVHGNLELYWEDSILVGAKYKENTR